MSFCPVGPYPILKLLGEQGSAKSTTARVLRAIIDPNTAPIRAEPRSTSDLMIAAKNAWIICLDNLSAIKTNLSDALCRLATGGGYATRALFTNEGEATFYAQRPIIITSINDVGIQSDLMDRSLIIELPPIKAEKRKTEKMFWEAFEKDRPRILGALLDVVVSAIRRLPEIERKTDVKLPRLADFYMWAEACEVALGLKPGAFAEAYAANQETATQAVLESSPVTFSLLNYLKDKNSFVGTATEMLETLEKWPGNTSLKNKSGWPKNPRAMSYMLRRATSNLEKFGITAGQISRGSGNNKEKVWEIKQTA